MLSQKTIIIGPTAAIISTLVCYITVLSVYRLFLHPLAKFPGLKLAALTKWYEFYFDLLKGHGGPIVRINPFELHVQDPDWFDTLYAGNPTRRDKYPPAASMAGAPLGTFGTVEHDIHRKRRAANIRILSDQFERYLSTKEIIDLRVTFLAFTTDTITRYALGENKNLQENKTLAVDWSATIRAVARITPPMKQFPWMMAVALYIPIKIIRFFMPELSRLVHYHAEMRAFAERFLSQQQASQEKQKILETSFNMALFQCISDSNLPAHEKSAKRLAHEAVVVISAAAETTSRALSIAMFYILSGRQILRRLRDEIDIAMPDYSISPSAKALEGLPYLVATVKEALRISAIITSRMPLMAHTELAYKNWKIPPMAGPAFFPFVIE
ncbi:cytochrome P450 [Botrytis cinerea]